MDEKIGSVFKSVPKSVPKNMVGRVVGGCDVKLFKRSSQ